MTRTTAKKVKVAEIVRGGGNVFADLNLPDAEERQTKLRLAYALNTVIDAQRLTQDEAAKRLGLNQPKVSALRNYKLEGFSVVSQFEFFASSSAFARRISSSSVNPLGPRLARR